MSREALAALEGLEEQHLRISANIAAATIRACDDDVRPPGRSGDADSGIMAQGLAMWRALDAGVPAAAHDAMTRDVIAIRNVVFRPDGTGMLAKEKWDSFAWPGRKTPFVIVDPESTSKWQPGKRWR